jgi:hypothetical protein
VQPGAPAVGKRTLVEQIAEHPAGARASAPGPAERSASGFPQLQLKGIPTEPFAMSDDASVQRKAAGEAAADGEPPEHIAARGVAGAGSPLPHLERIQASFGPHDVSGVTAHEGPSASEAAHGLGAQAFAFGNSVAFASPPDLHTAAHEAAHVVQQRGGVQLKGGINQPGDTHEQHADAVADAVVAARSAAPLLDQVSRTRAPGAAVQRKPDGTSAASGGAGPAVAPPKGGINKAGFIDNSDGANIRTGPAESGGQKVRDQPLPPATRVFVSGTHPDAPQWWYVTAYLDGTMVRGYIQDFRVTTELPEPTAKLHQVVGGDTAEQLAVKEYSSSVRDGHDLRYYENVLRYVNQQQGRAGIAGSYQDPGILGGGGSNSVQLVAGHRIWLVSPAYAKALEAVVPSGSLTGGAVAKVGRFVGHLEDILHSVTRSPQYFGEVAGEYAQAIRDHLPEIVGIVAGFLMAEATSAFLAATPTGVSQIAATVIQLGLSAFGAAGAIQAGAEAIKHASEWLTIAWTAQGKDDRIAAASKEFLKMLVSIAIAALSALGAKTNYGNALKIASSMPTGGLPALAVVGGGQLDGAGTATGVLLGPGTGSLGAAGNAMMQADKEGGGGQSKDDQAAKHAAEKKAAEDAAKEHVHKGGIEADSQSPYYGKWDGSGVHDWDELEAICARDGYRIKSVTEDPVTSARRVEVERTGVDPKTKAPATGTIKKTIYPKDFPAAQIDEAGDLALKSAVNKEPGTKLDPYGSKTRADGSPADGFFEAAVKVGSPPRSVKIQGWFKETSDGTKVITSHAPAYDKSWPKVAPKDY